MRRPFVLRDLRCHHATRRSDSLAISHCFEPTGGQSPADRTAASFAALPSEPLAALLEEQAGALAKPTTNAAPSKSLLKLIVRTSDALCADPRRARASRGVR
jgi:hypothetical protein